MLQLIHHHQMMRVEMMKKVMNNLERVIGVVVKRIHLPKKNHERTMVRYKKDIVVLVKGSSKVSHH